MKLSEIMDIYISFKRGLGVRFLTDAKRLHAFCRAVGDVEISDVDPDLVVAYINGQGPVTAYWHHKYKVLNRFYRFAINRGYAASSPLPVESVSLIVLNVCVRFLHVELNCAA